MSVAVWSGDVSRTWRVAPADDSEDQTARTVELRHHTVTGTRVVFVDNQAIETTLGSSTIFSALFSAESDRVQFPLPDGRLAHVEIKRNGLTGFSYTLFVAGERVPEATETAEASTGPPPFAYKVSVPEAVRGKDAMFEPVVWFRVDVERTTAAT